MNINYIDGMVNGDKEIAIKLNNTIQVTNTWFSLMKLNRLVIMMNWSEQDQRILSQTIENQKNTVMKQITTQYK